MLKTGICSLEHLISGDRDRTLFRKVLRNASISLYEKVCAEKNADELAQRILLLFSDERGAYKRTYAKRFEEFDQEVCEILEKNLDIQESLKIHDVGVSDGRTSVDFFHKVVGFCPHVNFAASDYNPMVKILEKGRLKVTLTESDQLLEITYIPFVFNTIKRDSYRHYPLNHVVRKLIELFMVIPLLRAYKRRVIIAKELFLFAPSAINLEKSNKNFKLTKHDVLQAFKNKNNIIRAMNVLNPSYFPGDDFSKIIMNIYNSLEKGGLFVTGSNQEADTVVDGAFYQKTATNFKILWMSGNGSPIHNHIEKFVPGDDNFA